MCRKFQGYGEAERSVQVILAELEFQKIPIGPDTNQAKKTAMELRRNLEKIRNDPLQMRNLPLQIRNDPLQIKPTTET